MVNLCKPIVNHCKERVLGVRTTNLTAIIKTLFFWASIGPKRKLCTKFHYKSFSCSGETAVKFDNKGLILR